MLQEISGQIIWITGAGSGIGEASALALAAAGATVVLSGRREERLQQVADKISEAGGRAEVAALDVSDATSVHERGNGIIKRHGRLDVLVNNAGLNILDRNWEKLSVEGWKQIVDIDLNGAFYCCHAVIPQMRKQNGGLIINISSWAGRYVSAVSGPAYSAAKHAMNAMNESINQEECRYGIRATSVCPGEVATEILDKRPVPVSEEDRARMLQPEDLADLVLYLCSAPAHVCINDVLISPTWNRGYVRSS